MHHMLLEYSSGIGTSPSFSGNCVLMSAKIVLPYGFGYLSDNPYLGNDLMRGSGSHGCWGGSSRRNSLPQPGGRGGLSWGASRTQGEANIGGYEYMTAGDLPPRAGHYYHEYIYHTTGIHGYGS